MRNRMRRYFTSAYITCLRVSNHIMVSVYSCDVVDSKIGNWVLCSHYNLFYFDEGHANWNIFNNEQLMDIFVIHFFPGNLYKNIINLFFGWYLWSVQIWFRSNVLSKQLVMIHCCPCFFHLLFCAWTTCIYTELGVYYCAGKCPYPQNITVIRYSLRRELRCRF